MNDFQRYAFSNHGISSSRLDYYQQHQQHVSDSMTPYILEERTLQVTQLDIFSRLMKDRIIWIAGQINDAVSTVVQAQLMYLSNSGEGDIILHIDTPGGSVKSGLSIVDVMDYVKCDIQTINTGSAASMGSILLGAGTKGKRYSLKHSKVMLHQSSGGFSGNIQDAEVDFVEWKKINIELFELLGQYCGKTPDQVMQDAVRDLWLNSQEAKDYGIIDDIILKQN